MYYLCNTRTINRHELIALCILQARDPLNKLGLY